MVRRWFISEPEIVRTVKELAENAVEAFDSLRLLDELSEETMEEVLGRWAAAGEVYQGQKVGCWLTDFVIGWLYILVFFDWLSLFDCFTDWLIDDWLIDYLIH